MAKSIAGKKFVLKGQLTRITQRKAKALIHEAGGQIMQSICPVVDYVVIGETPGPKVDKAYELGLTCLSEEDLLNLLEFELSDQILQIPVNAHNLEIEKQEISAILEAEVSQYFKHTELIRFKLPGDTELEITKTEDRLKFTVDINLDSDPAFIDLIKDILNSILDAAKAWTLYQESVREQLENLPYFELDELSNKDKENFSYAYINLIAATARLTCQYVGRRMDDEGVDVNIMGVINTSYGERRRHNLFAQVKCTSRAFKRSGMIVYNHLTVKNYNELRDDPDQFILILVLVPETMNELAYIEPDVGSFLRCEAYWYSLRDAPSTSNQNYITVEIPQSHLLNGYEMQRIMKLSVEGEL